MKPSALAPALASLAHQQYGLFTWQQAVDAGYTKHVIRGHALAGRWQRVQHSVYLAQSDPPSFWHRCAGALLVAAPGSAVIGCTALRAHGISALSRYERIHVGQLEAGSTVVRRGIRLVRPAPACIAVARSGSLPIAVAVLDEALRRGLVERADLEREWGAIPQGARGRRTARRALELTDPRAESPPESMLRVAMVMGGLPAPEVQLVINDAAGDFLARSDLGYSQWRIAIEYDGAGTHRDDPQTFREDRRRQNQLLNAGWTVLRFTGADLFGEPAVMIATIRAAIAAAMRRQRSLPA